MPVHIHPRFSVRLVGIEIRVPHQTSKPPSRVCIEHEILD
jgi:hypothetical protein